MHNSCILGKNNFKTQKLALKLPRSTKQNMFKVGKHLPLMDIGGEGDVSLGSSLLLPYSSIFVLCVLILCCLSQVLCCISYSFSMISLERK